jgi:hypothetical protein
VTIFLLLREESLMRMCLSCKECVRVLFLCVCKNSTLSKSTVNPTIGLAKYQSTSNNFSQTKREKYCVVCVCVCLNVRNDV